MTEIDTEQIKEDLVYSAILIAFFTLLIVFNAIFYLSVDYATDNYGLIGGFITWAFFVLLIAYVMYSDEIKTALKRRYTVQ